MQTITRSLTISGLVSLLQYVTGAPYDESLLPPGAEQYLPGGGGEQLKQNTLECISEVLSDTAAVQTVEYQRVRAET